jgi:hypothetical protein
MLRETRGETPKGCRYLILIVENLNWGKEDTMETISIHDIGIILAFIALASAPRAFATCLTLRK